MKSQPLRLWVCVGIACIIGVFYCPALFIWRMNEHQIDSSKLEATRIRLFKLEMAADRYAVDYDRYPGPNLMDFITGIEKHEGELGTPVGGWLRRMIIGDEWNRPLVFRWRDNGMAFTLRSVGPNGVDEMGGGDDIEVSGDMPYGLRRFRGANTTQPDPNARKQEDQR